MMIKVHGMNLPHIILFAKNQLIVAGEAQVTGEVALLQIDKLNIIKLTSGVPN